MNLLGLRSRVRLSIISDAGLTSRDWDAEEFSDRCCEMKQVIAAGNSSVVTNSLRQLSNTATSHHIARCCAHPQLLCSAPALASRTDSNICNRLDTL